MNIPLHHWLTIHKIPGITLKNIKNLLDDGTYKDIFQLSSAQLRAARFAEKSISAISTFDWEAIQSELYWLKQPEHHLIPFSDPRYPSLLKEIYYPPMLLFAIGDIACLDTLKIAVVGSRHPTQTGINIAMELSEQLSMAGLTIWLHLALMLQPISEH